MSNNYIHILREENAKRFDALAETAEDQGQDFTLAGDDDNLILSNLTEGQQEALALGLTSEGIRFYRITV